MNHPLQPAGICKRDIPSPQVSAEENPKQDRNVRRIPYRCKSSDRDLCIDDHMLSAERQEDGIIIILPLLESDGKRWKAWFNVGSFCASFDPLGSIVRGMWWILAVGSSTYISDKRPISKKARANSRELRASSPRSIDQTHETCPAANCETCRQPAAGPPSPPLSLSLSLFLYFSWYCSAIWRPAPLSFPLAEKSALAIVRVFSGYHHSPKWGSAFRVWAPLSRKLSQATLQFNSIDS